ncbi:MAG TPA: hypothetical protein VFS67_23250 [Polyangiaceae bacterium]|nr:hypothetical protein [Polyangiaceae bacterium]
MSAAQWRAAEQAALALRAHFAAARFAAEVSYGVLLVPDPERLDTSRPLDARIREGQLGVATEDVFDPRLPTVRRGVSGRDWNLVVSVVSHAGPACGSYFDVARATAAFQVAGRDVRALMTRQVWGARVLQAGRDVPDCERNERWTFTLFAGEALCEGLAESGTVLKGKVRFRLGKPDRGIGSARVAPAIAVE